jgi:hypothetical protein
MGKLFDLPPDLILVVANGIDDIIDLFGKDCQLHYKATKFEICPNCYYDPVNKRSTGRYKPGGPEPFPTATTCPVCDGKGRVQTDTVQTEIVKMSVVWDTSNYIQVAPNVQSPNSRLYTRGYMSDLPKILKTDYLTILGTINTYTNPEFIRAGEPVDASNIVQGRYFECYWDRRERG